MRWAGHVARMGMRESCIEFWWGTLRKRVHWGDPGVDVITVYGAHITSSCVGSNVLLHQHFPKYVCSAQYGSFL
jgi:hypothetical protein